MRITVGTSTLSLVQGDITAQDTEAIVNAANSSLLGGGGVDGAIHRAGGMAILEACKTIRATKGECPTGEVVITTGGNLKARYVIHAVGPVWRGGQHNEDNLLRNVYSNSLLLAKEHDVTSVALPSISTGIYGFPIDRASKIAFTTVTDFVREHRQPKEIRFVVFSKSDLDVYAQLFKSDSS